MDSKNGDKQQLPNPITLKHPEKSFVTVALIF